MSHCHFPSAEGATVKMPASEDASSVPSDSDRDQAADESTRCEVFRRNHSEHEKSRLMSAMQQKYCELVRKMLQ